MSEEQEPVVDGPGYIVKVTRESRLTGWQVRDEHGLKLARVGMEAEVLAYIGSMEKQGWKLTGDGVRHEYLLETRRPVDLPNASFLRRKRVHVTETRPFDPEVAPVGRRDVIVCKVFAELTR